MRAFITCALVFGLALGTAINFPIRETFFQPDPYSEVTLLDAGMKVGASGAGEYYRLHATFKKNACEFQYMQFWANSFDRWVRVPYFDDKPEGDRVAGWTTFDVRVPFLGVRYEKIELRTRHNCKRYEGQKEIIEVVDKVFYRDVNIDYSFNEDMVP